jgi:ankyrin repeat protein
LALLEAGFDARQPRSINGVNLLHWMILDNAPNAQEAVALLLKYGADAKAEVGYSDTLIRSAGKYPETVRALVEAGADVDHIGPDGITDVIYLTSIREWESATYLVEKGARQDVRNDMGCRWTTIWIRGRTMLTAIIPRAGINFARLS